MFGEQLWVCGGSVGGNKPRLTDVWRFNPATRAFSEVKQGGTLPLRSWSSPNGFDRAAVHGGALLVFGESQVRLCLRCSSDFESDHSDVGQACVHAATAGSCKAHATNICLARTTRAKDETRPPSVKRAAPGSEPLVLHALDLCSGAWSAVPTAGAPGFDHLEALVVVGGKLVAAGWQSPRGSRKDDTPMLVGPGGADKWLNRVTE